MSFLTDALRVVGSITAPVLAATGVGIVPAILIGAGAAALGNGGADLIENAQAKEEADRNAAAQKRAAEELLEAKKREEEARAKAMQDELNRQLAQAALPGQVLAACRNSSLDGIPSLLQQMTNEQFNDLGLTPIAECTSADAQNRVLGMLEAERARRGIV